MSDVILRVDADTKLAQAKISKLGNQSINLNVKNFNQPLGKITGQLGEFEKSLEASNARVIAFGASAGAIFAIERALAATVRSAIDVEKSLTDINVILNLSSESLSKFGSSLFDIAKNTGNTFKTVADAATELSRQGLGVEETLKRTQNALILTRLSGLSAVDAVEALTATINGFSKEALNSSEIVSKFAAVDAAFAVSSADLAEAVKRVGSSASDAGISLDQLIAIVTTAQQITARGGAVIGNSFKTIFTRLQRTDTLDALESLGIATRDTQGNILPLINVLQQLARTYDGFTDVQKASVAETVGGVFQINILKAALSDLGKEYSIYGRALNISNSATNEAVSRNEELNKTFSSLLSKTVANLTQAGAKIGGEAFQPGIEKILTSLNSFLEDFSSQDTQSFGAKIAEGLVKGIGSFLSGPGILLAGKALFMIFERLAVFSADALKTILGLNARAAEQAQIQRQIFDLLSKNPQIIAQINQGSLTVEQTQSLILKTIQQQTAAMQQQIGLAKTLATSLSQAGVSIAKTGIAKGRVQTAKYGGYIPNFANQDQLVENIGAAQHGYKAGKAYRKTLYDGYGGFFPAVVNSAETVKTFTNSIGKKATIVQPPNGFSSGYIPNFAINDPLVEKGYVKITGQLQDIATRGKAGVSISKIGKALGVINGPADSQGRSTHYVPAQNYEKLIGASKKDFEKSAIARGAKFEGKREPYALVYPSFTQSAPFLSAGSSGGKSVGFDVVPFPGNIQGKQNKIIGPDLYRKSLKSLVENASEFLVSLAGVDPKLVNDQKFKNYLYSNITQDQIGSLVGNAFEGGILASLNIVPEDRSRVLDLSREELKKLGNTFKIPSIINGNYLGGDFKNAINPSNLDSMAGKILSSKSNKSFGFIPNFAALEDAVSREKNAGINSSLIRVGTDSRLVSNSNPLGLGVYNTKDEPGGLKQGIARNKYKGHIPNFAKVDEGLSIEEKQKRRMERNIPAASVASPKLELALAKNAVANENFQKQLINAGNATKNFAKNSFTTSEKMQKYSSNLIGASIGASILAGQLKQFGGENSFTNFTANVAEAGATFSTIGSIIPGPVGLTVGAFLGLAQATNSTINDLRNKAFGPLIKNGQMAAENLSKFSEAGQKYISEFENLSQAYTINDPKLIQKAQEQLAQTLLTIDEKYRNQISSAKDLTQVQDIYRKGLDEQTKTAKGAGAAQKLSELMTKDRNIYLELGETFLRGTQSNRGIFTGQQTYGRGEILAKNIAAETVGGLDKKFFEDLQNGLINTNLKGQDFIKMLEKYGLTTEESIALNRLNNDVFVGGAQNLEVYRNAVFQTAMDTIEASKKAEKLSASLKSIAQPIDEVVNKALAFTRQQNFKQLEIERQKGIASAYEQFIPEELQAQMQSNIKISENQLEYEKQLQEVQAKYKDDKIQIQIETAKLNEQLQQSNALEKQRLDYQLKQIENQKTLTSMGGIESLFDPKPLLDTLSKMDIIDEKIANIKNPIAKAGMELKKIFELKRLGVNTDTPEFRKTIDTLTQNIAQGRANLFEGRAREMKDPLYKKAYLELADKAPNAIELQSASLFRTIDGTELIQRDVQEIKRILEQSGNSLAQKEQNMTQNGEVVQRANSAIVHDFQGEISIVHSPLVVTLQGTVETKLDSLTQGIIDGMQRAIAQIEAKVNQVGLLQSRIGPPSK